MDVPSVQEDNQIGRNSSPKQPTSELKHEFDYKDICCVSADQKNETSENLGKESAETRVLDSISYSVEQLRPPEEATKSSCSEPLRPPPEDASLSSIKKIGLPAESVTREISSPQQTTSDLNHELGSESMKIDVLEQKQVIPLEIRKEECDHIGLERVGLPPDEVTRNSCREQPRPSEDFTILCSRAQLQFPFESAATNANFEKSGSPVDDVSNNRGLGQLEAIQEDATYITSKLGHEEKGEAAATNSNPEESAPPPDDVSRTRSCGQLGPMLEDATHDTGQLGHGEKGEDEATDYHPEESGLPPDDVSNSQGLEEWQPMQEDTSQSGHGERGDYAATNSSPEGLRPPPDYLSTNQGVGQMEPMQEDAVTSSNPQASGEPPDYVSKNQSLGQLEQMQEDATHPTSQLGHREKVEDAATNSNPEKLGPPPDDVSKNQRLGRIELMQEVATPNSSQLEHGENGEDIARNCNPEELGPPPGDISNNKGLGQLVAMQEDATHNTSQVRQGKKIEDAATDSNTEELGPPPDDVSKNQDLGQLEPLRDYATRNTHQLGDGEKGEDVATNSNIEESGPPPDDVSRNHGLGQLEQAQEYATHNTSQSRHGDKGTSVKPRKGKKKPRPLGSPKVLRSRSQEKSKVPEQSKNLAEDFANKEKKRKKQQQMKNVPIDEFLRIRRRLRYLLTRMKYEQNFIDAYSGEGWKGQSLEKIKPEKELQRAKSEIFRLKLKIRDLFQRLHVSCAEGRLPESLFDSEGEIDSEDIFCAKCGSKELLANNDIILCDGACERGFHQFCLEPPLLNEDIPPDDEGWLCPGCDCKVDCTELLNDSQGTNLSISDSWEKVFPEAAAAASGNNMGDISGLPSDDSEDDDYDPGGPELHEEMQGGESSSDESDFSSASDDLGALPINDQNAGLPSDDSEDDDYNPNSLDLDVKDKQESSSSDFTSDSEYFSAGSDDNRPSDEVQGHMPSNGERSKLGGTKRQTSSDELLSLLESGPGGGDSAPPSGKRHVERLDYKRLHDETYGNVSSDSSDEDYMDTAAPKRRKTNNGKLASVSPNRKTQNIKPGDDTKDTKHNQKESERTSKRRTGKKLDDEATGDSPAKSHKGSSGPDSGGTSATRSAHGRLGEAVTQRLLKSFKENQYPGRVVKENLATELSLTVKQVSKWFENARWSFNHSMHMESKLAESASRNGTRVNNQPRVPEPKIVTEDPANNGLEKSAGAQNSRTTKSRKRKVKSDNEKTEPISSTEEMTQKQNVDDTTPKAQELRRSGRVQSKTTDSVS